MLYEKDLYRFASSLPVITIVLVSGFACIIPLNEHN